jgi:hypothetical protein
VKEEYETRRAKYDGTDKDIATNTEEELASPMRKASTSTISRAEPRVLHGHTFTTEISFREVCVAIKETAFVTRFMPTLSSFTLHFIS